MTERSNYDSHGLSTGLAVGDVFADLEAQMIVNRKAVFDRAKQSNDFRAEVMRQFAAYREANTIAAQNALATAGRLAGAEVRKAYNAGVSLTDAAIRAYAAQGHKAERQSGERLTSALELAMSGLAGALGGLATYAQQAAAQQLLQITSIVNPGAEDLDAEIDRAQAVLLVKGIPGAQSADGTQKQAAGQAEFLMRDSTHNALLTAQGARAAEYGQYLIQVSSHPSSCPLCIPWQSRVLVDDLNAAASADGKHELASMAKSGGLWHYNCRHTAITYIPGYSKPDLFVHDRRDAKTTSEIYAVEQQQRHNERMIREWKRRELGSMSERERLLAGRRVQEWQARQRALREVAERRGLPYYRQYNREQIGGETTPTLPSILTNA